MFPDGGTAPAAPVTRGFLFADLRGYTAFTENHGDKVARELLDAYRRLVREVVAQFGGANQDQLELLTPNAEEVLNSLEFPSG